jgi:hypothetical protein
MPLFAAELEIWFRPSTKWRKFIEVTAATIHTPEPQWLTRSTRAGV